MTKLTVVPPPVSVDSEEDHSGIDNVAAVQPMQAPISSEPSDANVDDPSSDEMAEQWISPSTPSRSTEDSADGRSRGDDDEADSSPAFTMSDGPTVDDDAETGADTSLELTKTVEAMLFLSPEAVTVSELAQAAEVSEEAIGSALQSLIELRKDQGVVVREVAGGYTLATVPEAEDAARRLLGRPRTPPLSAAQAETLAIVAYVQSVSRPEIARIRGVASESATQALVERGLIEESGRSQFGAVLYRVTTLFFKLFGMNSLEDLPDPAQWDPTPEEQTALRERLLAAGDQRAAPE